ncbi:MAG: carboxylating nicotinate-nucleotide diphosphorylase [Clostridiales bacterium]|nr:carboxylating nicotinate-nucleotide diphosphorylase [Clostridiales bacterium]
MNYAIIDELIKRAFEEDFPYGDITSEALIAPDAQAQAVLMAKEAGVICGLPVFARVFALLGGVECRLEAQDGDIIEKGRKLAFLKGNTRNILKGERTALNFTQRLSGIATKTRQFAQALAGSGAKLLDTRKTTPGLRCLEKYAVSAGGGLNHRFGLSDGILIKDNHIAALGGVGQAVAAARAKHGFQRKIEVEAADLAMVGEALAAGAEIIMLDNMDDETMKKALQLIGGRALTECSGNVDLPRLQTLGRLGVDYISCGALTHSFSSLDLSLIIQQQR